MKTPPTKNTITRVRAGLSKTARKLNGKELAKQRAEILETERLKRETLGERELKILPEYNFFGLPKWM